MLAKIDRFIIDKVFQPLTDELQLTTGKSCYWYAAQSWLVAAATALIDLGMRFVAQPPGPLLTPFTAFVAVITPIILFVAYSEHKLLIEHDARKDLPGTLPLNPDRTFSPVSRVCFLFYAVYILVKYLIVGGPLMVVLGLANIGALYFACCTPLPPGTRRERRMALSAA